MTPFEKNLEVWRQLWRVLERSDLVCQVVDSRDPLRYRCADLESYVEEARFPHASRRASCAAAAVCTCAVRFTSQP